MRPANVADYRELARRRIPKVLFDYVDGGAFAEATLRANSEDFQKVHLRQRVLVDVSEVSLKTELLGQEMAVPMVLSPIGMAGMYARRGEVQAARAARKAGVPMCLSTMSICDLQEVAKGSGGPTWFQLYMLTDRGYMKELLHRAHELGCPVLAFTVDLPVPGTRYRDIRNGLAGGGEAGVAHVLDIMRGELATALALTGCTDVRKAGPDLLIHAEAALKDAASAARSRGRTRVAAE